MPAHALVLQASKELVAKRVRERSDHPGKVQGDSGARLAKDSVDKLVYPQYSEGFALINGCSSPEEAASACLRYQELSKGDAAARTLPKVFFLADDFNMPSVLLGTMGMGKRVAKNIVSKAIESGFKAVDTAPTYKNEERVGEGLSDDTCCTVKVPKRVTMAEQVRPELKASLSNLGRSSADLLLLHWPCDVITSGTLKPVWEEMEKCKAEGLCNALGVCNFNIDSLRQLLSHCTVRPVVNQVERHPLLPQWELADFCANQSVLLQAHSPLGHGDPDLLEHEVVKQVASASGLSPAQVLLGWNLQQGVSVVPKCSTEEHLREVVSLVSNSSLKPSQMKTLDGIKESKRVVEPPFMFGTSIFAWGARLGK